MTQPFPPPPPPRWLWIAGLGLGLALVAVICVLLVTQNRTSTNPVAMEISKLSADVPSVLPTVDSAVAAVETLPKVPHVDLPRGSWEEVCGLNELPPYWVGAGSLERNEDHTNAFESVECQTALETHMNTLNPYHFLLSGPWDILPVPIKFVVLDDPLTFEQVFADPTGDATRVQDALARPECVLTGNDTNWELQETCHADALLNFALINTLCFNRFDSVFRASGVHYAPDDHPTPEQDRLMWKQDFENAWVDAKCEGLDLELKISSDRYPVLYELAGPVSEFESEERKISALLVELAARLGDDTAGLTQSDSFSNYPPGNGYKYGRISKVLAKYSFGSLKEVGTLWRMYRPNDEPTKPFLRAFNFLTIMDAPRANTGEDIEFDWEWVVRHICVPVELSPTDVVEMGLGAEIPTELQSCREIVHELRQLDIKFRPVLDTLDKFEQVAIELGVYE
ncbi:MAG: hypothetical protein F4Z14_11465 [Gammaproteobacteria bacterium]|nr:hypothetical protein [Gammaproteobacteria bacterium]